MDTVVEFKSVSKKFQNQLVLEDVSLTVEEDDFLIVYGLPSSGKTVLLRLLMGLEDPDSGDIILRAENARQMPPKVRNIGYVPQDFALIPHKTIFENIAYPLRLMKKSTSEIKPIVERAAAMLNIDDLFEKLPTQLSGGQKQRVAVARGIVKDTDIYLFDDPLAGLDFKLRERLIDDLRRLQKELAACFIYATSDPIESLALAANIAILHKKTICEIGDPFSVYFNPQHLSTIDILGFPRTNLLAGRLYRKGSAVWCKTNIIEFPILLDAEASVNDISMDVTVAVRPESIQKASAEDANALSADIYLREDLGAEEIVYLNVQDQNLTMMNPSSQNGHYDVGDQINISIDSAAIFVYESDTGARIGRGGEIDDA
ncbi:MAG: ABC transporter ATP-binding protein [Desulfobacterales bacterium]|jgi:ABC-type sugar transport system ATPase subunit